MSRQRRTRPIILFALGDPAGIGPEIIVRAMANDELRSNIRPVLVGSERAVSESQDRLDLKVSIRKVNTLAESAHGDFVPLIDPTDGLPQTFIKGKPDTFSGEHAVEAVLAACSLLSGDPTAALVLAPASKAAMRLGRFRHYGSLADIVRLQLGVDHQATKNMLVTYPSIDRPLLRTHVTSHIPLREVSDFLLSDAGWQALIHTIQLASVGAKLFGISKPRIAVTGMNPHLEEYDEGEHRLSLGKEERELIAPVVSLLAQRGVLVSGPIPADAAYRQQRQGISDVVVAMYHDQSHLAALSDTTSFQETIDLMVGLPCISVTTAHGVALDIADKYIANPASIENCIRLVLRLNRKE